MQKNLNTDTDFNKKMKHLDHISVVEQRSNRPKCLPINGQPGCARCFLFTEPTRSKHTQNTRKTLHSNTPERDLEEHLRRLRRLPAARGAADDNHVVPVEERQKLREEVVGREPRARRQHRSVAVRLDLLEHAGPGRRPRPRAVEGAVQAAAGARAGAADRHLRVN